MPPMHPITEWDILAADMVVLGVRERLRHLEAGTKPSWMTCTLCGGECTRRRQFGVCDTCYEGMEN